MPKGRVWYREDFDATEAVEALYNAGENKWGTNEEAIIKIMGSHNWQNRIEIAESYKAAYGSDLIEVMKDELSGDFEDTIVAMLTPPIKLDAQNLKDAISGIGTDETTLIEVLATKTNYEIEQLKEVYKEMFEVELEEDLKSDTSGHFRNLMVSLVSGARQENDFEVEEDKAEEDAQKFFDAGEAAWGTDEGSMNSILCLRSRPQLALTFEKYHAVSGRTIQEAIESECGDELKEGFLAIVETTQNLARFWAKRIHAATAGLGTSDSHLIRLIVTRSEGGPNAIDMDDIEAEYQELYDTTVTQVIEDECGGDYKKMLLALLSIDE